MQLPCRAVGVMSSTTVDQYEDLVVTYLTIEVSTTRNKGKWCGCVCRPENLGKCALMAVTKVQVMVQAGGRGQGRAVAVGEFRGTAAVDCQTAPQQDELAAGRSGRATIQPQEQSWTSVVPET